MADSEQERTEEATQTRREDFRKRGQVAQTKELGSVLVLFTTALVLMFMGRFFLTQMSELITETLGPFVVTGARTGDYKPALHMAIKSGIFIVAPLLGIFAVISAASTLLQTGLLNNEEALDLKFEKLNPVEGFKRMFSLRSIMEGAKATIKVTLVIAVTVMIVKDEVVKLPFLIDTGINQIFVFTGDLTLRLLGGVGVFMGVLAAFDYFFQRWDLEKQMRMTKQEIKEEHKSREGDPMIKARIRRIQREMANKRMMSEVPKADVIITNPTHIAIALKYDPATMPAPQLIAKGAGVIAERIKAIAKENRIPIVENKPLARTIFKTLKIGHIIPRELFTAVAQVLSYVYKLRRRGVR